MDAELLYFDLANGLEDDVYPDLQVGLSHRTLRHLYCARENVLNVDYGIGIDARMVAPFFGAIAANMNFAQRMNSFGDFIVEHKRNRFVIHGHPLAVCRAYMSLMTLNHEMQNMFGAPQPGAFGGTQPRTYKNYALYYALRSCDRLIHSAEEDNDDAWPDYDISFGEALAPAAPFMLIRSCDRLLNSEEDDNDEDWPDKP